MLDFFSFFSFRNHFCLLLLLLLLLSSTYDLLLELACSVFFSGLFGPVFLPTSVVVFVSLTVTTTFARKSVGGKNKCWRDDSK